MFRSAFKRIGRAFKHFGSFVAGLSHKPNSRSTPDPRKAIARDLTEVLHTIGPSEGGGGKGTANDPNMEPYLAKIISEGYSQTGDTQTGNQKN